MAEFDEAIRKDVSAETLQWHLEYLCTLARDSGTPPERQAADYIMEQLRRYGVDARLHEFDAYLSYPLDSTLEVVAPERITLPSRPRAFSASTPDDGIEGEVVFIGEVGPEDKGKMIFAKAGQAEEYRGRDVSGKIVLSTGGGPDGVALAQEHGALALIHMWPSGESNIHEMIVTPVWGTPTPESAGRIPRIPTVSITRGDGERLRAMLDRGSVRLRLRAKTWIGWKRVPLPVGHIPGRHGKEFLLVGAHIDSWYYGATDNATGDACLLELARVLARHQNRLRAGVRFAWWPGHSTGRYAGSTWYVDNTFEELRTYALGYLNIDSPGVRGSKIFDCRYNMGEVERFMV
ncbi:MAG: M28 family peptidase, partial [Armatimonadetes bacterium]|nr:M28 family peptidase [Armatimonadota bacterium]